jgi:FAD/FMN-containing dehydrogenase
MLSTFEQRYREHDHVEFYWFPHTDWTLYKEDTRLPGAEPVSPPGRVRSYIDDELLSNTAFEGLCRLGHTFPAIIPHTAGIAARALSAREYVDVSHAVLTSPRRVRFREMEYAVPREAIGDVLCDVRAMIERRKFRISFPIEIRVAAADDIWLSTASGRETAYIAVHQYWRTPFTEYFAAAEEIFKAAAGRPHWGKLHTLTSDDFAERYPHFADFQRVRDELDPERRFANAYLDAVLGT